MAYSKIGFLLLGAGSSKRMCGKDKLLEKINGVSLIERLVNEALSLKVPVFVAIPATNTERKAILSKTDATIVPVRDSKLGMGHSIAQSIIEITRTCNFSSLAICPSDLPALKANALGLVLDHFFKSPKIICRPVDIKSSRVGHPVIFPKKYFEELKLIKGDTGARQIIQKSRQAVNGFVTVDESYFLDLDTPEDFYNWKKRSI
jgi:CTP:molybdopterin cytidylyltransferase MocA